jgi:hypothetical protein
LEHANLARRRSFADDPLHAEALLGLGTLVGFGGAVLGYDVHDRIELGAGIGANHRGLIGGPYVRVRPIAGVNRRSDRLHALALDAGLSVGPYEDLMNQGVLLPSVGGGEELPKGRYISDSAYWLHLEPSWETRSTTGFTLRLGLGFAKLLNPGSIRCVSPPSHEPCSGDAATLIPVVSVGLGQAF